MMKMHVVVRRLVLEVESDPGSYGKQQKERI